MNTRFLFVLGMALSLGGLSQVRAQSTTSDDSNGRTPGFVVHTTTRSVDAVKYQHRGGSTKVNFAGTALMPSANGEAEVKSQRGALSIEAEFGQLDKPTTFGTEYLTYILWAISPEGRAINLGEVLVGGNHRSKLNVTTDLQAFALIVTAEPYYAVRQPSDVVVLENVVRSDTRGATETVNAKYELMGRGGYIPTGYKFDPVVLDAGLPLEFLEARNAVRIAQSEGADKYASDSYQHAVKLMDTANSFATEKHSSRKELIATSRETVQTAEDARAIALKNRENSDQASERQHSADALAKSQSETDEATRQKENAQSDTARAQSDTARAQADAATSQSNMATAEANATRAQEDAAKLQANMAAAQADASQAQANAAKSQADMEANQASATAQVNAANASADASRAAEQTAQQNLHQSDSEKAVLRAQLEQRLNQILQTRDSARGLIVNMSDVLFDSGKFSLNPGAREKLSKVAGILVSYPSLNIEVGGYTDNVGSDELNQTLSQNRAGAVRDYLVNAGVASASVSSRGFGSASPVASNHNPSGRQSNRRVELVVSGEAIGVPSPATTSSLR